MLKEFMDEANNAIIVIQFVAIAVTFNFIYVLFMKDKKSNAIPVKNILGIHAILKSTSLLFIKTEQKIIITYAIFVLNVFIPVHILKGTFFNTTVRKKKNVTFVAKLMVLQEI